MPPTGSFLSNQKEDERKAAVWEAENEKATEQVAARS